MLLNRPFRNFCCPFALLALMAAPALGGEIIFKQQTNDLPAISIIIDDLGNARHRDERAIRLPGELSYSFLPYTPHAAAMAELAHTTGKDVLLHLPMESTEHSELGPGGLTMEMNRRELWGSVKDSLAAVPHAIGINNHMGSLLTQHPGHMQWLMQSIGNRGDLFFVDSYTIASSVAQRIATENWVPNIKRDVFLDSDRSVKAIEHQFHRLLEIAQKQGIALAIGHPYPETLTVLEQLLPTLKDRGVRLVPVSQLVNLHMRQFRTWRAFLSL